MAQENIENTWQELVPQWTLPEVQTPHQDLIFKPNLPTRLIRPQPKPLTDPKITD